MREESTGLRLYFYTLSLGLLIAVLCGAALSWDGSHYLYKVLYRGRPWVVLDRVLVAPLHAVVVLASRLTDSLPVLRTLFCLGYALPALVASVLAWLVVRDTARHLFVWAAFGICVASLPGQFFFVNDGLICLQLFWPLLLAILIGQDRRAAVIATLMGLALLLAHPFGAPLLGLAAVVAAARGWLQPPARRFAWTAAALLVLGALASVGRLALRSAPYEMRQFDAQVWRKLFDLGVAGMPLIALVAGLLAAIAVYLRALSVGRGRDRAAAMLGVIELLGLMVAAVALVNWAAHPLLWTRGDCFRGWALFVALPFYGLAIVEGLLGASASSWKLRGRTVGGLGCLFLIVLGTQSVVFDGLTHRLMRDLARASKPCVEQRSLRWLKGTPLDHWATPSVAVLMQGREQERLMLDGGGCNTVETPRKIPIGAWTWQPPAKRPRHLQRRELGWFHFERVVRRTLLARAVSPTVQLDGESVPLGDPEPFSDFPSLAIRADGTLVATYAAFLGDRDQIFIHERGEAGWSDPIPVPTAEPIADVWMPQVAVDGDDRAWVVWSEGVGRTPDRPGNWDIYARSLARDSAGEPSWGPLQRLSTAPTPDLNPHVATDGAGGVGVVWQAHPEGRASVQYARLDDDRWSPPVTVGADGDGWYPQLTFCPDGTAWIAFDSYRNGDFDVYLASVAGSEAAAPLAVAASGYYEAQASVVCASNGRLWIAWEEGRWQWGKDRGAAVPPERRAPGKIVRRTVRVASYHRGVLRAAPPLDSMPSAPPRERMALPSLVVDGADRLWLRYRTRRSRPFKDPSSRNSSYWYVERVKGLGTHGWGEGFDIPGSRSRIGVFSRMVAGVGDALHLAYSIDGRRTPDTHIPHHDRVLVASLSTSGVVPLLPKLEPLAEPPPPAGAGAWDTAAERASVARLRDHIGAGRFPHALRGDVHRHSEFSYDVGPGNDGSLLDFYRYAIAAASLDFAALTDHQGGHDYPYWRWLTEKSVDMYHMPPYFMPLYGYERSVSHPGGHRNILHGQRGVGIVPFTPLPGRKLFNNAPSDWIVANDTELLHDRLRASGGIAIQHTSGHPYSGTDWRYPPAGEVEPVVEIYQGLRGSFEAIGAPRVGVVPSKAPEYAEGMVDSALARGHKLGFIASSDHGSTHAAYAVVYTAERSQSAVLEGLRARRTYAATDDILVDLSADGRPMGAEYTTRTAPNFRLSVHGTGRLESVTLIRDGVEIQTAAPNAPEFEQTFADTPAPGTHYYYFRVLQADGEIAWTSPVWVTYQP